MILYILKRIVLFIPALLGVIILAFILNIVSPGDPVDRMLNIYEKQGATSPSEMTRQLRAEWRQKMALHLPVFYISLKPLSWNDDIRLIPDRKGRELAKKLSEKYGNANHALSYYNSLQQFISELNKAKYQSPGIIDPVIEKSLQLNFISDREKIQTSLDQIKSEKYPASLNSFSELNTSYERMISSSAIWKSLIPVPRFHADNQFHRWLLGNGNFTRGIIYGDFGKSYITGLPVLTVILSKIRWSFILAGLSIFFACLISIPIAKRAAAKVNSPFDKWSNAALLILFSVPSFWLASMLLILFANPDVLKIFPSSGISSIRETDSSFIGTFFASLRHLVLPLICYTVGSLALLARTLRSSMIDLLSFDFVRTAKAKGLPEKTIINRHVFRNAKLPFITIISGGLPAALAGSVIIESIFSIPGMGQATVYAIQNYDYPFITAIFTLTGIVTMLAYLIADILYAYSDPRIRVTLNQ